MMQITRDQIRKALKRLPNWKQNLEWAAENWIKENARWIALANLPKSAPYEKNKCGEWPDGWKKAMIQETENMVIDQWASKNCRVIDGVEWCCDWSMIQRIEKRRGAA